MKYMLLIYSDLDAAPVPGTPEAAARTEEWMQIGTAMGSAWQAGAALQGPETATVVRTDAPGGDPVLADGPFGETKELLAGYYVVDVPDLDAAVAWAARLPLHPDGAVEVRPVWEIPGT